MSNNCQCLSSQTKNVKLHFKIKQQLETTAQQFIASTVTHHNFDVIRFHNSKLVISVFGKSGHVNMTGIDSFQQIASSLRLFNEAFVDQHVTLEDCQVDCSTSKGRLCQGCMAAAGLSSSLTHSKLNLYCLGELFKGPSSPFIFSHRPHFFPGALLRSAGACTARGSVIVFSSGNYVLIGPKSAEGVVDLESAFLSRIRRRGGG